MPAELEELDGEADRDAAFALKTILLANLRQARWLPGEKLPTERRMATLYKVGRATVRRVLGDLKAQGLITQTVGSGTYVASDVAERITFSSMSTTGGISPAEVMEARLIIEPALVPLAIRNGNTADFTAMENCCRSGETARTLEQFEHWDAAFHHALAVATHNEFIVNVAGLIGRVRDKAEWGLLKQKSATPERRLLYQREHWTILRALRARDIDAARDSLAQHLLNVRRNMFDD